MGQGTAVNNRTVWTIGPIDYASQIKVLGSTSDEGASFQNWSVGGDFHPCSSLYQNISDSKSLRSVHRDGAVDSDGEVHSTAEKTATTGQ